jgi:hypothetical protein
MRMWRRNRRIRRFVLALAVAAVVAPAAQARVDEAGESYGAAAVRPDDLALRPGPTSSVEQPAPRPDDLAQRPGPTGSVQQVALRPDDLARRPGPTVSVDLVAVRPDDLALRPGTHLQATGGAEYGQFAYRRALPQDYGARTVQVAGKADGFDWSDAGIGAGSLFGALLLVSGAALLTRRVGRQKQALA